MEMFPHRLLLDRKTTFKVTRLLSTTYFMRNYINNKTERVYHAFSVEVGPMNTFDYRRGGTARPMS